MCGRLACGLSPEELRKSCCYKRPGDNTHVKPEWKDCHNSGKTYKPSYNICPTELAPVLLSGGHFKSNSRLISPMIFGVIPQWANYDKKVTTINCRFETIKTSKLYGPLLKKGQRCAVICNGFFEWQKGNQSKKPYFCHEEQPPGVLVDDPNTWSFEYTEENGYSGFKPLKLAALFETDCNDLEKATLSFTIITKEASCETSWPLSRIPGVLKTDEQLDAWLNYEEVGPDLALNYICERSCVMYRVVSDTANKITNKDISCIRQEKESVEGDGRKKGSAMFLKNWLEGGQKRKSSSTLDSSCEKIKKEDV